MAGEHAHFQFSQKCPRMYSATNDSQTTYTSHEPCECVHPLANRVKLWRWSDNNTESTPHTPRVSGIVLRLYQPMVRLLLRLSFFSRFHLVLFSIFPRIRSYTETTTTTATTIRHSQQPKNYFNKRKIRCCCLMWNNKILGECVVFVVCHCL